MSCHQRAGSLDLFGVLRLGSGFSGAPAAVAVVTTIVRVPAQDVPQFWPGKGWTARQYASRHLPGGRGCHPSHLFCRENSKMGQQQLQPRDALPRAANVPALTTKPTAFAGQAIVGSECHRAAAEDVGWTGCRPLGLKDCPPEGAMANVKSYLQIGRIFGWHEGGEG